VPYQPDVDDLQPGDRSTWTGFELAVARVLDSLERGDVLTYGEVAAEAGHPGAHRAVGSMLRRSGGEFAWWRIVNSMGRLVPGNEVEQARLLASEGVRTRDGRVVEA
jgi:methylated-DNA-protein-cysteine methyltransferase-like protein